MVPFWEQGTLTSRQAGKISISEMARSGDRWG